MSEKIATLTKEDNISIITLDDGKANVFSEEMSKQINQCLDDVPTDTGCLVLQGRDGMFSAGFDLKVIQNGEVQKILDMSSSGFKLLARVFSFPRPVIASCSGHGIALGTFLLCCCDFRVGIKGDFMLGANEMRTNMVIPTPILELIRFRLNPSYKYRAILGAEMYSMEEAKEAGLLDIVVDPKELKNFVIEKAKDLATMGHPSYSLTKELLIKDSLIKINNGIKELES
ncbi:MAG: enoyl-CoA hydratase [Gammaproteobacteria bacterium]|nr:enoyl-CoA hydratase [Gammaproteobacteria bacterium]|tara:strand:- start:520 stop:1206 length:687 start_codon:yes stop_codon:yes gene_type:complete